MNSMNLLLNFLNREHYQTYHTPIARYLKSVEAAILFAEFVQRHQFHEARNELLNIPGLGDGWFYHTKEHIEERTAINRYNQDKAVALLKEFKLLDSVQYGMPCKRYLRLNFEGFEELSKNLSRKSTVDRQGSSPSTDKEADLRPTDSLYIEEPKEEPKKEGIAQTVSRPRKGDPSISFSFEEHKFTNLTQKDIQSWKEIYPDLDILREIKRMQRWALDNPTKSKPKKNWGRFISNWLKGEHDKLTNKIAYRQGKKEDVIARHTGFQKDDRPVHPSRTFDFSNSEEAQCT